MANKNIFKSGASTRRGVPAADTINEAGGVAYKSSDKQALAQIAATNCFNGTYYASSEDNLKLAKDAALKLRNDPEFIAKVALYSRDRAYMKDMPSFLTVVLADTDKALFRKVFRKVIDNGKMLRNFCQMARSGAVTGRVFNLSSGSIRRAVQEWFDSRSPEAIFRATVGNNPTLKDILRMCRPRPNTPEKEALFGYIIGKKVEFEALPQIVQSYERYKATREGEVPNVDFRMLDSLGLSETEWKAIARDAKWMMTRMNLNTFARHNVFGDSDMTKLIAARLRDPENIKQARAFPYQLFSAWKATSDTDGVPFEVRDSLQDAMELAIDNVPTIEGQIYVCVDQSGSMSASVTGSGGWGSAKASEVRCADVAGLVASAVIRKNRSAEVWTFSSTGQKVTLNPRDTVLTNCQKLAQAGGGTNISAPLAALNAQKAKGSAVIYVSDNESWLDRGYGWGTGLMTEWETFQRRNPNAKLICIDLLARANSQVKERKNILQVGGFSDQVFDVVASFVEHGSDSQNHWVDEIERVSID